MKIQSLAVIFIIIILPISMVLNIYIQNQVKTLDMQLSYDTKLNNATYDALKAFQLNTINSDSSDLADSKLRDIEASVNTFFNSIASNFNMAGYNQGILKEYVPALVYTMYDGYYIYSPFINTLDKTQNNEVIDEYGNKEYISDAEILNSNNNDATYTEGEKISGLKPYVHYSCRYKKDVQNDFIITYSLDNYITIQGIVKNRAVNDSGYLLNNIEKVNDDTYKYRGIEIENEGETLKEWVPYDDENNTRELKEYPYVKINGVKYYKGNDNKWFSILNGEIYPTSDFSEKLGKAGINYYKDAYDFTSKVLGNGTDDYNLTWLSGEYAVDENGETLNKELGDYNIFNYDSSVSIEDSNSNFNQQRLAVIKYSIEKNLSIAIANYNYYSPDVSANFQMPKLKEDEWDKIVNNVSIISFLQGLSIGGKVYNGYSIINNNKNKEVVNEDSIYILTDDNQYHRANDNDLVNNSNIRFGVLNIDLEVKTDEKSGKSFMPKQNKDNPYMGCYSSIVTQTNLNSTDNMYKYIADKRGTLAKKYFTALGRERYGMYRTNNKLY